MYSTFKDIQKILKTIKVVAFDFDNTLVDEKNTIIKRWKIVLNTYKHLSPHLTKTFFQIYDTRGPDYKFHVNDTLKILDLDTRITPKIVKLFLNTFLKKERIIKGAEELLVLLNTNKIPTGIITNGKKGYHEQRIKKMGFDKYIDFIFYGDEYQKPDTWAFNQCLNMHKVSGKQMLYVGDNLIEDIFSASSLDIFTCWINQENRHKETHANNINKIIQVDNLQTLYHYFNKILNLDLCERRPKKVS